MRSTGAVEPLNSMIFPSAPTGTTARLATFLPCTKFKFDALGRFVPEGQAVRYPSDIGPTAVRLTITADTPDAGTPPLPVTSRACAVRPPSVPPLRVSRIRDGVSGPRVPAAVGVPSM